MSKISTRNVNCQADDQDTSLVLAARDGSSEAFEQLLNRYFGLVYTLAYARLREHEVAQDLTQEVFLRLYLGLATLREPQFFGTWASRVTRNLASDWVRNRQRASSLITLVPLEESQLEEKPAAGPGAREQLLEDEQVRELRSAILRLPVEQREILLLHYQRGMTQQEIGARLDMHHTTVGRHLQRAVAQLRSWASELESLNRAPNRPLGSSSLERQALMRTLLLVGATSALSTPVRSSIASVAAEGMVRLGAVSAQQTCAAAASGPAAAKSVAATKVTAIVLKGTLMTGKSKGGIMALAAVAVMGVTYHKTHPGELTQLLRGTTPSTERIAYAGNAPKASHTPTMGPGEEVYLGNLGEVTDKFVVRMKPVPGKTPKVEFDVPGALIMEYPVKVVHSEGERYIMEATGQMGLKVNRTGDALIGEARLYNARRDRPSTFSVHLKRVPASLPVGRSLPQIVAGAHSGWLDQFVGDYVINSAMTLKITRQGDQLYVTSPRQEPLPIYHLGNNRFFYRSIPEELSFHPGPDGKIVRIIIHHERDTPGRKVS